jgi:hypothetical protein
VLCLVFLNFGEDAKKAKREQEYSKIIRMQQPTINCYRKDRREEENALSLVFPILCMLLSTSSTQYKH